MAHLIVRWFTSFPGRKALNNQMVSLLITTNHPYIVIIINHSLIIITHNHPYIVTGWWYTYPDLPLWKIWKSVGMMTFPISGKIKSMFQTTNQVIIIWLYISGWWFSHLGKYKFVNGKDDIPLPYMKWKNKSHVPNHQSVVYKLYMDKPRKILGSHL